MMPQAGIRLAGILNQCFDSPATALNTSDTTICDKVYDGKYLKSSHITFLNVVGAYPNQKFSVVVKGNGRMTCGADLSVYIFILPAK